MKKRRLPILNILGLLWGIVFGVYFPEVMKSLSFMGTVYINLLKFMIVPVILTSIICTIYQYKSLRSKFLVKTVGLFLLMFLITFGLTSLLVNILKPGMGATYQLVEWNGSVSDMQISDVIVNLFPSNMMDMWQKNAIFSVILFAIAFGLAMTKTKEGEKVIELIETIKEALYQILKWIMYLTPLATFSLVGGTIANYGNTVIGTGLTYIGTAYLCSVVALIVVMILPVWLIAKVNPFHYVRKMAPVWLMTTTTCSSVATLPTTIKTCQDEFQIPRKVTDIVAPLGCTIHMCGGAVSFALLGFFCLQLFQVPVTVSIVLQMLLSATVINMAAPGIPNGGIVIGATYLSLLGIPLEFIGFYSGIYKLLDMAYTTLNVTGDVTANILLAKNEKKEE